MSGIVANVLLDEIAELDTRLREAALKLTAISDELDKEKTRPLVLVPPKDRTFAEKVKAILHPNLEATP